MNLFDLELFLFNLKSTTEIEKKQFQYEFNQYIYYYKSNNKYFNLISNEIEDKGFNVSIYTKEKEIINAFLFFFDNIKIKYNLTYNSKQIISQLITNFIFLSSEVKINSNENDVIDLQWIWQYNLIENIKELLINFQLFYNESKLLFSINNLIYKRWIFFLIRILIKKELLKEKHIRKNKKTLIFISFIENNLFYYNLKIFLDEPKIINYNNNVYLYGQHFISLKKIFNENKLSNDYFKLYDFEFLKKIKALKYYINWDFYNVILFKLQQEFKCDEFTLQQNILYIYKEIIEKKNCNYTLNELILYLQFLQIKIQLFNEIEFFYFSYFFDFRGRLYSYSCISPIGSKLFRYIYYYGYYTDAEINNLDLSYFPNEIINLIKNQDIWKFNFVKNWQIIWAYWCFFEIGKLFKSSFIIKNKGILTDKLLITIGLEKIKFLDKIIFNKLADWIEFYYILISLNEIKSLKPKRIIIFKDATASGIQLLTLILGAKNEEILQICNLYSQHFWFDTYYFIIDLFLKEYPTKSKFVKKYFTRKYLKKIIMTYNYSIGFDKAKEYFFNEIDKKDKKNKTLKHYFELFFKFLKSLFEKALFYNNPSKIIIDTFKEHLKRTKKIEIKLPDDSVIYLQYNQLEKTRIDRITYKYRNTIIFYTIGDEIDEYKTFVALRANLIHSLDATYVRFIIKFLDYPIITIHDSFGIDILSIPKLILIANKAINTIGFINELNFLTKNVINYNSKYILF